MPLKDSSQRVARRLSIVWKLPSEDSTIFLALTVAVETDKQVLGGSPADVVGEPGEGAPWFKAARCHAIVHTRAQIGTHPIPAHGAYGQASAVPQITAPTLGSS